MQQTVRSARPRWTKAGLPSAFGRPLQRITVEQYHRMIDAGVFSSSEKCELVRGVILEKPVPKPPHSFSVDALSELLRDLVGPNHIVRTQQPVTMGDSEPEPDVAVAAGTIRDYKARHPAPDEIKLLVEVADSTLRTDRTAKLELYAESGIICYWIVDLVHHTVEVHTHPRGGKSPGYRKPTTHKPGDSIPVVIDGKKLGVILTDDILP